jgi:hypothetical protein
MIFFMAATDTIALLSKILGIQRMRNGVVGKCRTISYDIALSKLSSFTKHPMRMCGFR